MHEYDRMPDPSTPVGVNVAFAFVELVLVKTRKYNVDEPPPLTVDPGQVMVGLALSVTVTTKLHVLVSPALSVALQLTVVVPRANDDPLVWLHPALCMPEMSLGLVLKNTRSLATPDRVEFVAEAGHPATGGVVSVTLTVNVHVLVSPALSVTVHDTAVITPRAKNDPLVTLHVGPDRIPEASEVLLL